MNCGRNHNSPRLVQARSLVSEDFFDLNAFVAVSGNFGDAGDLSGTVAESCHLNDQLDGRSGLLADDWLCQSHVRHQDHRFDPMEAVSRRVGVHRRHGAVVAGIHGLEHIERLRAA